jgi:hypothetical protein
MPVAAGRRSHPDKRRDRCPGLSRWFWLLIALLATSASAGELASLLDKEGALWKRSPDEFMAAQAANGFRWVSQNKDTARSVDKALTFAGVKIWEGIARFEGNTLHDLTLSLYNRGDAGDLSEAEFEKLRTAADQALTRLAGVRGVPLHDQDRTALISISRMAWVAGPHRLDLIWSYTPRRNQAPFRAEYIRLTITPYDPANPPRAGFRDSATSQPTKTLTLRDIQARVRREPNGDVLITGVPMVDQGQKGYCGVAVMERMLRYFGRPVDEHELAQMANTGSKEGTSIQGMFSALRQMSGELGMEVVVQEKTDVNDFLKLMTDYNQAARQAKHPTLDIPTRGSIDLGQVYRDMDADLLRTARTKREARMQQFKSTIVKYIEKGCPLAWAVMLGKVRETPELPQIGGGHMRLIIGLNSRQNEVLYSDSWGAGHELKRMSLADAWTITMEMYTVEPRNMRF